MKRTIIHIEVGNDNWTPTTKDLANIRRAFRTVTKATTPSDPMVVATRDGVKVRVIEFDPDQTYLSLSQYAAPLMMTNQANPADLNKQGYPFTYTTTGHKP